MFFDAMGIAWEYEKEGFSLDYHGGSISYLPDFWLPNERLWFEVKGETATNEERLKCELLGNHGGAILLAEGNVGNETLTLFCHDLSDSSGGSSEWDCHFKQGRDPDTDLGYVRLLIDGLRPQKTLYRSWRFEDEIPRIGWFYDAITLEKAYAKARQARFEHSDRRK